MQQLSSGNMTVDELQEMLRATHRGALLINGRLLRRIIKQDLHLPGIGLQVPHRKGYVLSRDRLAELVPPEDLGLPTLGNLPDQILLLASPDPERLATQSRLQVYGKYWRLLFHLQIHAALQQARAAGKLPEESLRERVKALGFTEFAEIKEVLAQEKLLFSERLFQVYEEFVAAYYELSYFSPSLLAVYFPGLKDCESIASVFEKEIDAQSLLAQTRPPGAPEAPAQLTASTRSQAVSTLANSAARAAAPPGPRLLAKAERASARGNQVRAAIYCQIAAQGESTHQDTCAARAKQEIHKLVERLKAALPLDDPQAKRWEDCLSALLPGASNGTWPAEERFLYDLQKVCTDQERGHYAVELVEWVRNLGRRPIKRLLPLQPAILRQEHLHSAAGSLRRCSLEPTVRKELTQLLQQALESSAAQLGGQIRPLLTQAFDEVGLNPANLAEEFAQEKIIEELLDRVEERGFLNMGDLRDALSRNQLKLDDLQTPWEWLQGDRLLHLNERLAVLLDGVYHRGEIYLRGLQRASSLASATRLGRFVTRYIVLPFAGAYCVLEGIEHAIVHPISMLLASEPEPGAEPAEAITVVTTSGVTWVGVFLLALLYIPGFRQDVAHTLKLIGRGLRFLFYDLPAHFFELRLVRELLASKPVILFREWVVKPLVLSVLPTLIFLLYGASPETTLIAGAVIFVLVSLGLNSRLGRRAEDLVTDSLVRTWFRFQADIIPGAFRFIMALFKQMIEYVERGLYEVDEWLRFRSGESRFTLVFKMILGTFWFFVTYAVRIYVNLLIEPTFNPIKHFPVVTVAAKLMLPFTLILAAWLKSLFLPLGQWAALALAGFHILILPGLAGFLVWELKENWKLYKANRATSMRPEIIGHHGETMLRLLRPGIHSGTIPKLFARLRRAERRYQLKKAEVSGRKYRASLHEVKESLEHFIERSLCLFLRRSRAGDAAFLRVGKLELTTNAIQISLTGSDPDITWMHLEFEQREGWLIGSCGPTEWLKQLNPLQRGIVATALAGTYTLAGVHVVRQQIESAWPGAVPAYDFELHGIRFWQDWEQDQSALFHLGQGQWIIDPGSKTMGALVLPPLAISDVYFEKFPLPWARWVEIWSQEEANVPISAEATGARHLLP